MTDETRHGVLRAEGSEAHRVTYFELFFDLVYVFAITQLSHGLLGHLDLQGGTQTAILLLPVWIGWVYTAWATNWIDPNSRMTRLMLIGVMACALVMASAIPEAFAGGGLVFALAYSAMQVGRSVFVLVAFRGQVARYRNFQRIVAWNVGASVLWVAGGLADPTLRPVLWLAAIAVDLAGPAARFAVPGLGRSDIADWTITASHFAERFKLFVILALGESIVITGGIFSALEPTTTVVAAFALAFLGTVTFWWIYFDRAAELGTSILEMSSDAGRLARSAYTYFHLPIVAGILVTAVADDLIIGHPDGSADPATVAVTLGGPALFLAGHALYKWAMFGVVSIPRLAAIVALAALAPIGTSLSPLVLGGLATVVVILVAVLDVAQHRSMAVVPRERPAD